MILDCVSATFVYKIFVTVKVIMLHTKHNIEQNFQNKMFCSFNYLICTQRFCVLYILRLFG